MNNTHSRTRETGSAIDLGVAALAAVSIGFVTFAMPEHLFSSLIAASHLPGLIAAAAPPLGFKARLVVLAADAGLTFILVWALLRSLGGAPAGESATKPDKKDADPDAPRLRRADAHPDAPARRPLFAGADLGEPTDIYELDSPEVAHEPAAVVADFDETGTEERLSQFEARHDLPESEAATPVSGFGRKLPRFIVTEEVEPARDPIVPPSQKKGVEALTARLPEAPDLPGNSSIGSLMQRLERGLSEREESPQQAPLREEPPLPPALASAADPNGALSPEGVRHRLRSAISDLNQVANRG